MGQLRIREYEIVDGPFSGTYGQVFIGRHMTMGWTRAIKRLHLHVKAETIREEAQKQKDVRSPYVVQILEFFEDPPAIVMEYCPLGLDKFLKDRLGQTSRKIPYEEAREILHEVLQGLNDAHKSDVVHGDIKPANVRFGEDRLAKLGDFGAARRLRQETPSLRGSTNWMAPEVLDGSEATRDSDYFSFGVLAYLVLTGRHPFFADDPSCLTSEEDNIRSLTFKVRDLSELRTDVPPKVAELVMELLSRDARVREKAEQALKAALSEQFEPEEAPPLSAPQLRQPKPEEISQIKNAYNTAREFFFVFFRPKDAVEVLDGFLRDFRWERFEGQRVAALADCWSLRSFINNSAAFFDDAVEAATNGLRIDNNHVNSLHARGYAYIQLGKYPEASRDLEKALDLAVEPRKRDQIVRLLETLKVRQQ